MSEVLAGVRLSVRKECESNEKLQWFWRSHIAIVEWYAEILVETEKADREVTLLGVYLHDIARIKNISEEEHDVAGASIAAEIMRQFSYKEQTIEKVKGLILTHRCGERKPGTLEEKILATADAMSHFRGDFYLQLIWNHSPRRTLNDYAEFSLQKLERDFREKIFFDSARETIKADYEALKRVFSNAASTAKD